MQVKTLILTEWNYYFLLLLDCSYGYSNGRASLHESGRVPIYLHFLPICFSGAIWDVDVIVNCIHFNSRFYVTGVLLEILPDFDSHSVHYLLKAVYSCQLCTAFHGVHIHKVSCVLLA